MQEAYTVYTDGSCLVNPGGPGGWACVVMHGSSRVLMLRGGSPSTTNNRMEIMAAIMGLRAVPEGASVVIFTDSQYLANGANNWCRMWERRGKLDRMKNPDMWREILRLKVSRDCRFQWVRGHSGDELNDLCDRMADQEARRAAGQSASGPNIFT